MKLAYIVLALLLVIGIAFTNGQIEWIRQAPSSVSSTGSNNNATSSNQTAVSVISYKVVVRNDTLDSYVCGTLVGNVSFGDISVQSEDQIYQAFVVKYDANGIEQWVNLFNSSSDSVCFALALVSDGGIYVGGEFRGNFSSEDGSSGDDVFLEDTVRGFLIKYDSNGSLVSFLAVGEDGNSTSVQALGSDSEDNVFVTGNFDGNITLGNFSLQAQPGSEDLFIARWSDLDQVFVWANATSGNGSAIAFNIATNPEGFSCLVATFSGNVSFDSNVVSSSGGSDDNGDEHMGILIEQFDRNGTVQWFAVASSGSAFPYGIDIDSNRICTAAGSFKESLSLSAFALVSVNVSDTGAFFIKFSSEGAVTVFKTSLGEENDIFTGVSCNNVTGDCWVSGFFTHNLTIDGVAFGASSQSNSSSSSSSTASDPASNLVDELDGSDDDDIRRAIVLKFDAFGFVVDHLEASPGNHSSAATSIKSVDEEIWVTGVFDQSLTLGTFSLTSPSNLTMFVFRANGTDSALSGGLNNNVTIEIM